MDKIKAKLKEKKGAATYIELSILVLICVMMMALMMSFLQLFSVDNRLRLTSQELARYIEIKGQVNSATYAEFERLAEVSNFNDARVEISKSGKIALEEEFTVTVYISHNYGIGGIKVITREMSASASGRSEVYWK